MVSPITQFILRAKDETGPGIASAIGGINTLKGSASGLLSMGVGGLAGGFATALLGAGFMSTIGEAINSLDKMDEAAERIGLTTESLSGLAYAGKLSGVEFDDMATALSKLSVKMQDAASGGKEASAWFNDVGVSVNGADGNLKSVDVVLAEVADRFRGFEDGAGKTALAVDGFGKSGAKLVPMLNQGAAGLKEMHDEAASLGGIIDGKLAKQSAEFNDNLDRLAVLSASAGKAIAADLVPWLNEVATSFLIAQKHSTGFWDSLGKKNTGLQMVDISSDLKSAREGLDVLEADRARWIKNGNSTTDGSTKIDSMIAAKKREIEYFKELQRNEALAGSVGNYGNEGRAAKREEITRTATGNTAKPAKPGAAIEDDLTWAAKAYAKSMEQISVAELTADKSTRDLNAAQASLFELMNDPAWAMMPEPWKEVVIAQAAASTEAIEVAARQKRINDMIAATPTAKLEESRQAMQDLKDEFEAGRISAEQFIEAAGTKLGTLPDIAKEAGSSIETVITNSFQGMADAVADFALTGKVSFGDLVGAMIRDLIRLEIQTSMTTAFKSAGGVSGIAGAIGKLFGGAGGGQSASQSAVALDINSAGLGGFAKGGVFDSPSLSAYSNQIHNSPKMFAFAKGAGIFAEAGPEAIMPLSRDASGRLGVKAESSAPIININVENQAAADGYQATASAQKNGNGFDVALLITKTIAQDQQRNGPITQGFSNIFGLGRSAA